jgi:magnesium transporter
MITIYEKTVKNGELKRVEEIKKGRWINLVNPSPEEIENVLNKIDIPLEFVDSALDEDERPRIEKVNGSVLMIIRIPHQEEIGINKYKITTLPLGIIITRANIVTICLKENEVIKDFQIGKIKTFYTTKRTRFLLQILQRANYYYTHYLELIEKRITEIEASVTRSLRNEEILALLELQKTLVYFNTAIISNNNIFKRILGGGIVRLYEEDKDLLEEILIDSRQALAMSKIFSEILSNTMDAYASIVSNNLNIVMKFLASITIMLSIPTIVASLYGMNVKLPLQAHPHAFWITLLISLLLSFILAMILIKKRWL